MTKKTNDELLEVLCKEFNGRETVIMAQLSFDIINSESTLVLEELWGGYAIGGIDLSITTDLTCTIHYNGKL